MIAVPLNSMMALQSTVVYKNSMPMPMAKLSLQVCLSYGLWSLVSAVHTKVESSDKSNEVVCRDILHIDM